MSTRRPADEPLTAKIKRWSRDFDAWVERQLGRLEPAGRRRLAILMGACIVVSVAIGGIVQLVMEGNGTLKEDESPFYSGLGIAAGFAYVAFKALTYKEPPLMPEQQRERELREAWRGERSLDERKPWPQFMAWPESRGTEVAVLVIRRDPDGAFGTELFEAIDGDSTAEQGAELMWRARAHAEQAEVDAIAAYELTQLRERERIEHERDADRRQREAAEIAEQVTREANALAAADARDRRTETEGLAAAMRPSARKR
jgi:hypothetical protein